MKFGRKLLVTALSFSRCIGSGRGKSTSKKKPLSLSDPKTQKLALIVVSGLLFVTALAALLLVALHKDSVLSYNLSMKQFAGHLIVEKDSGSFLEWSDEYQDLSSASSQSLATKLSATLLDGLEKEGVLVDDLRIVQHAASEPQSFTVVTQVAGGGTESEKFDDVRFVNVSFETYGTPAANIPVFVASNNRWGLVADVIQARLGAAGLGVRIEKLEVQVDFIRNVQAAARDDLSRLQVPPTNPPLVDVCDCEADGRGNLGSSMECRCESPCFPAGDKVLYGGAKGIFTLDSPICLAAFYLDAIEASGGIVEVIPIGNGNVTRADAQNGLAPADLPYQADLYKIKSYGPVIKPSIDPISPLQALELQFAQGRNTEMMVVHVLYTELSGRPVNYGSSLGNIQSSETKRLTGIIKPKIVAAVKSFKFTVGDIEVTRVVQPPEKKGALFGFLLYSDDVKNAKVGAELETKSPGSFAVQLAGAVANSGGTLRSVRYATGFLEKMKMTLS